MDAKVKLYLELPDDFPELPENAPAWIREQFEADLDKYIDSMLNALEARTSIDELSDQYRVWSIKLPKILRFQRAFGLVISSRLADGRAVSLGWTSGGFQQFRVARDQGGNLDQLLQEAEAIAESWDSYLA